MTPRRLAARAAALSAVLLLAWTPAAAQSFPELTGRVVDQADLLTPAQEIGLSAKLEGLEKQSGRQLVVATIASLEGRPIEDYGYRLGRAWGIGAKERDDGALLIVAPNERKVRIEVGYGLEPVLTDALSTLIIQERLLPRFRENDYPGGIDAGVDAIAEQLRLPPGEAQARAASAEAERRDSGDGGDIGLVIFWLVILLFFVLPVLFGGRKGRRHRGMGPVVIWGPGSGSGGWGGGGGGWSGGGGFSGGGGSFGGGGASGGW